MTLNLAFSNAAPTRTLWVSTNGNDGNSGAEGAPFKSIQAAVNAAKGHPGTAIMVKAGTYNENVNISGLHGTKEAPIQLISADGPHAAKIVGGPSNAVITGYKASHVGIKDFHLVANTNSGDIGGVKIWGDFNAPARNLLIEGNLITGKGQDGLKVFMGATDIAIVGNTIDGNWRQEAMDVNAIENSTIAFNTLRGKAGFAGLTMKLGTHDVQVVGNDIDIHAGTGIMVGGHGTSHLSGSYSFDLKEWGQTMAERITVEDNVINADGRSLAFVASRDSVVKGNYLADSVGSVGYAPGKGLNYSSHNHQVVDNTVASADFFKPNAGQTNGFVVSGNTVDGAKPDAGAGSGTAKAVLASLHGQGLLPDLASLVVPHAGEVAILPAPTPGEPLPPLPVIGAPAPEVAPPVAEAVPGDVDLYTLLISTPVDFSAGIA